MRLLHVSDLHLGRDLSGVSRRPEQERLIDELTEAARAEAADLVVIAGDVYDTANPPAWAEDAFYGLLDGLAQGGRRAVLVIAGNHDNAMRLSAAEPLAKRLGIVLLGAPGEVPAEFVGGEGRVRIEPLGPGCAVVRSADGARSLAFGALPFVSEVALVRRAGAGAAGDAEDREAYGRALAQLFAQRKALLPGGMPHLLAGHLWVSGAEGSDSERRYRVGTLSDLPAAWLPDADYVALGHLHRPQRIGEGATPVVYAGSPIAYSIREAGQQKRAVLVELAHGVPAVMRDLPLSSGRSVEEWHAKSFEEVRARAAAITGAQPIVALRLDLGRPASRAEREQLHDLGPAFIDLEILGAAEAGDAAADGTALARELPDDELVRAFLEQTLTEGFEPELAAELLALLTTSAQAAASEAA